METGDRAPRTAGLARMLGRGLQPATPANEGTVELQQLVRCRTGLPNRSTAGRAGQGYGPGAVSGPPAATSADPFPSKATIDGFARAWCRPGPGHHKMVQPLRWWPCVLDGTPDRCQGRPFARLHLQQVAGRKGLHCCSIRSHRNLGRSGSLSSFGPEPPREPRLGSDPLLGSPAFLCAGAGLKPAELDLRHRAGDPVCSAAVLHVLLHEVLRQVDPAGCCLGQLVGLIVADPPLFRDAEPEGFSPTAVAPHPPQLDVRPLPDGCSQQLPARVLELAQLCCR